MSTDVHGGHGADPSADLADPARYGGPGVPDAILSPDSPPPSAATTELLPAVVDSPATEPAVLAPATPEPFPEPERPADCVVGPVAEVGDLCRWLSEAAARAGQPSSLALSASGREATVHFADSRTFNAWLDWYGIGELRYTSDILGRSAEGITAINGWVLRVRLSGPAVEELS